MSLGLARAGFKAVWATIQDALGELTVRGDDDERVIVDVGRGGTYGTGRRTKCLCYPATRPDMPARTVQALAEAKNSDHAIRVAFRNIGAGDGCGSTLDDAAPTVACGASGQEGLALVDADSVHRYTDSQGRVHARPDVVLRRLTIREIAALQTFPDDWPWAGPKTQIYRQIGNAVPPLLAQALGGALGATLDREDQPRGPRARA